MTFEKAQERVSKGVELGYGMYEYVLGKASGLKLKNEYLENEKEKGDLVLNFLTEKPISPELRN